MSEIAAESGHYYLSDGSPYYEVPRADGDGMRPATLKDARKVGAVPSVTLILRCAAAPGLEAWKARQLLEAALTLPRSLDETVDDYAKRVIEDSKAQGKKAAERGTALHKAIEQRIRGEKFDPQFAEHVDKLRKTMSQYDVDLSSGVAEHSFAYRSAYGGKLDFHSRRPRTLIDFKSKDKIDDSKRLVWDEHRIQLAAYAMGVFGSNDCRALNVFVGVEDREIRVSEWTKDDLLDGWEMFLCLLRYWRLKNRYSP